MLISGVAAAGEDGHSLRGLKVGNPNLRLKEATLLKRYEYNF